MSDTPRPPYHVDNSDVDCGNYELLVGPDGFECCLTEPEDRTWSRDLREAKDRLNEQHAELAALRAERDRLRAACEVAASSSCRCTTGDNTGCVCVACVCRRALGGKDGIP